MSGVEGVEREDYDECEAGIGRRASGFRRLASGNGLRSSARGNYLARAVFDSRVCGCRIEV